MEMQVKTEVDECIISETNYGLYGDHDTNSVKPKPETSIDIAAQSEQSRYCRITARGEDAGEFNCSVKPDSRAVNVTVKPENGDIDNALKRTENPAHCDFIPKLEHPEHDISPSVDLSSARRICRGKRACCVVRNNTLNPAEITVVIENDPEPQKKTWRKSTETRRNIEQQTQCRKLNTKVFHCDICGKDIKHNWSFQEHQRMHTNERLYECPQCHKRFIRCSDLIKHRLVHSDLRLYACPICGKSFKRQGDVTKHEVVHTAVYPFPCSSCGKRFKRAACLLKHERVHSAESPYRCPTCGRSFKWDGTLKEHQRTHSGERPYVCDEEGCGKTFAHRSTFQKHGNTHLNHRPFHCQYCHKGFNHVSNLRKHERAYCTEVGVAQSVKPKNRPRAAVQGKTQVGHKH